MFFITKNLVDDLPGTSLHWARHVSDVWLRIQSRTEGCEVSSSEKENIILSFLLGVYTARIQRLCFNLSIAIRS